MPVLHDQVQADRGGTLIAVKKLGKQISVRER
jgi:hypothetical protein